MKRRSGIFQTKDYIFFENNNKKKKNNETIYTTKEIKIINELTLEIK